MRQIVKSPNIITIDDFWFDEDKIYCVKSGLEFYKIGKTIDACCNIHYSMICMTDTMMHWPYSTFKHPKDLMTMLLRNEDEHLYEFNSLKEAVEWFYSQAK